MASRDLLFNGEQYLASVLRVVLSRSVSTPTSYPDRAHRMEACIRYCRALVGILFAYPLRLDDRKGQLRNSGSAVFCHFRRFARWVRLERDLYKTALDRGCCNDTRHLFDSQFLIFNYTLRFGQVKWLNNANQRISACAVVAGYIFSTIKEIVGFGIPML